MGEMLLDATPAVQERTDSTADAYDDSAFVQVPFYDVTASAGHGSCIDQELITSQISFRKDWLMAKGLQLDQLVTLKTRGDSMEPTLHDGDILLVDKRVDRIIDDSIYIVQADHHLIVKRLQQSLDGAVHVISDNRQYEKQYLNPEQAAAIKIAGRVCWYGHEI